MKRVLTVLAALLLLAAYSHGAAPVALFDQAHGQRFVIEKSGELDLGALAQVFKGAGFEVRSTDKPLTAATLSGVKVLISSGGFVPFTKAETDALKSYVRGGGNAVVLMHIAPTYQDLLVAFGIAPTSGVIHETQNVLEINSIDFDVKDLTPAPLFEGLDSFSVHGGWGIVPFGNTSSVIAQTSPGAWVDLNRNNLRDEGKEPVTTLGVVTLTSEGTGKLLVFGDDAIFQNRFLSGNNLKLAQNLAKWMAK